jgi:hypothetical protein
MSRSTDIKGIGGIIREHCDMALMIPRSLGDLETSGTCFSPGIVGYHILTVLEVSWLSSEIRVRTHKICRNL